MAKCVEQPPKSGTIALETNVDETFGEARNRLDADRQPITDEDAITHRDGRGRWSIFGRRMKIASAEENSGPLTRVATAKRHQAKLDRRSRCCSSRQRRR